MKFKINTMTEKMIIDAYCRIRTIDNSIPDDVLDFMKESALEKLHKNDIICYLHSPTLLEPLGFVGEPIYYKIDGVYGYLLPLFKKVLFFYSDSNGSFYKELNDWIVLI